MKIHGLTGMPYFTTRWRGRLDGKRGVVKFNSGTWDSHYIRKKEAAYFAFLHETYRQLEIQTAALHKESATLAVELQDVILRLSKPDPPVSGTTPSSQARSTARISKIKPQLEERKTLIQMRLASMEEAKIHARSKTVNIEREAQAIVTRRIQAYLHGASLSQKALPSSTQYAPPVPPAAFDNEADYNERHVLNDTERFLNIRR